MSIRQDDKTKKKLKKKLLKKKLEVVMKKNTESRFDTFKVIKVFSLMRTFLLYWSMFLSIFDVSDGSKFSVSGCSQSSDRETKDKKAERLREDRRDQ
jgi:hypothetical protein